MGVDGSIVPKSPWPTVAARNAVIQVATWLELPVECLALEGIEGCRMSGKRLVQMDAGAVA